MPHAQLPDRLPSAKTVVLAWLFLGALVAAPGASADGVGVGLGVPGGEKLLEACVYYDPEPDIGHSFENQVMVWVFFFGQEPQGEVLPPIPGVPDTGLGHGSEHAGATHDCPSNLFPSPEESPGPPPDVNAYNPLPDRLPVPLPVNLP